jgi:hypothetical protein
MAASDEAAKEAKIKREAELAKIKVTLCSLPTHYQLTLSMLMLLFSLV